MQTVYAYSIVLSVVSRKSWKNAEKDVLCGFNVLKFGTNRMGTCDLLLVTSNSRCTGQKSDQHMYF